MAHIRETRLHLSKATQQPSGLQYRWAQRMGIALEASYELRSLYAQTIPVLTLASGGRFTYIRFAHLPTLL